MRSFRFGAIFLLSAAAVVGASEFLLRAAGVRYPASLFTTSRDLGFVLRPYAEGWSTEEIDAYVKINSDGMRDREHQLKRPPDVTRVAFLGDSTTQAVHVPLEQRFIGQTERNLTRLTHRNIEGICFGVMGYSLPQQLVMLRSDRVWKYDPQVVVLSLSLNAAITRSVPSLYPGDKQHAPFFVEQNGALALDRDSLEWRRNYKPNPSRDRAMDRVNRSELLSLLNAARVESQFRWRGMLANLEPTVTIASSSSASRTAKPEDWVTIWPYLGPVNQELAEAWRLSELILLEINREVVKHNAELWIVTLDMPMQSHPDSKVRREFQREIGVDSLFIADERIRSLAVNNHIRHAILAPLMSRYAAENRTRIHLDKGGREGAGHWNETGHRQAGLELADIIYRGSERIGR